MWKRGTFLPLLTCFFGLPRINVKLRNRTGERSEPRKVEYECSKPILGTWLDLTYCLSLLWEHSASVNLRHDGLCWAVVRISPQDFPIFSMSLSMVLLQEILGRPFFRDPWGFHISEEHNFGAYFSVFLGNFSVHFSWSNFRGGGAPLCTSLEVIIFWAKNRFCLWTSYV